LGITGKDDVMKMGIDKYNAECRSIVMRYSAEWVKTMERMGRWIDFENDYKTLYPSFMESVWWVFQQLFDKNLVYRGFKVMPYSTGCTTPLSNFEAGQNYKDVTDPSGNFMFGTSNSLVVVSFPLKSDPETSLLAWTTTPWTLPSNLAVCVHPDFKYVKVHDIERKHNFILLESRLVMLYKDPKKSLNKQYKVLEKYIGKDLEGWEYEPLYDYFRSTFDGIGYKVIVDSYVTDEDGTGLVHQAPAFGEDDYRVSQKYKIITMDRPPPCPIDERGRYTSEVADYVGQYIKVHYTPRPL
jgi:isoleucyl-tRNA synthetase